MRSVMLGEYVDGNSGRPDGVGPRVSNPRITLNDNTSIPQFGLGVWQVPAAETEQVVTDALEVGYRHIDTAQMYGNEEGVGAAIAKSGLARDDLYVTTKLNNNRHETTPRAGSLRVSLDKLGLDQVDLFLIHWPLPTRYDGDFVSTWETMVELATKACATSVGVSNFQPDHLDLDRRRDRRGAGGQPDRGAPLLRQRGGPGRPTRHGAHVEAWSPLGQGGASSTTRWSSVIADRHGKTPAQVTCCAGHSTAATSSSPSRCARSGWRENFDIFDFSLTADEIAAHRRPRQGRGRSSGPEPGHLRLDPVTAAG